MDAEDDEHCGAAMLSKVAELEKKITDMGKEKGRVLIRLQKYTNIEEQCSQQEAAEAIAATAHSNGSSDSFKRRFPGQDADAASPPKKKLSSAIGVVPSSVGRAPQGGEGEKAGRDSDSDGDSYRRRRRRSTSPPPKEADAAEGKEEGEEGKTPEKRIPHAEWEMSAHEERVVPSMDEKTQKRHRNLFSHLMGTLKHAKAVLDLEKQTDWRQRQAMTEQKIEDKIERRTVNLVELRKRERLDRKADDEMRLKELEEHLSIGYVELLRERLIWHYSLMRNFLRTKAEPTVFFRPAKHNEETRKLLLETRAAIENKVAALKLQFAAPDPLEHKGLSVAAEEAEEPQGEEGDAEE